MEDLKREERRKKVLIGIIILLSISTIIILYIKINHKDYFLEVVEMENCNQELVYYYTDYLGDSDNADNTRNYYTYCLEEVVWNYKDKKMDLKEALAKKITTMEEVIKTLNRNLAFWDGGTILYRDRKSILDKTSTLTVISCDTLGGNQDFYIGTKDMEYQNGYCDYEKEEEEERFEHY